ncbi:MAG: hypothetical protein AB7P76_10430 [Candidatus Melainabacteria bacterium]
MNFDSTRPTGFEAGKSAQHGVGKDGGKRQGGAGQQAGEEAPQAAQHQPVDAKAMLDAMTQASLLNIAGPNVEHVAIIEAMAKFQEMLSPEAHDQMMTRLEAAIDDEFGGNVTPDARRELAEMTITNSISGVPVVSA